jgi:hypothetical protein
MFFVVSHWIFESKGKIRDNEHKQNKTSSINNEHEQRTTHEQQEQRTISNTPKPQFQDESKKKRPAQ